MRSARRTLGIPVVAALVALAPAACGGDNSTGPSHSVVGTYTLQTINGQPLPFLIFQGATEKYEFISDVVAVNADYTYSETGSVRYTDLTTGAVTAQPFSSAGTWRETNGAIEFTDASDGSVVNGTVSGNTLTILETVEGLQFTLVFRR
jgi:hypothetical protein